MNGHGLNICHNTHIHTHADNIPGTLTHFATALHNPVGLVSGIVSRIEVYLHMSSLSEVAAARLEI